MKTTVLKLALLLILFNLLSCSKDDNPTPAEENFLEGYLAATGFNQVSSTTIDAGYFEFGLEFTPLKAGKIKSVTVKLPDDNRTLRITIWDKLAARILRTETVSYGIPDVLQTFDIPDLELLKDKEYAITMNSNDWYNRVKQIDRVPYTL